MTTKSEALSLHEYRMADAEDGWQIDPGDVCWCDEDDAQLMVTSTAVRDGTLWARGTVVSLEEGMAIQHYVKLRPHLDERMLPEDPSQYLRRIRPIVRRVLDERVSDWTTLHEWDTSDGRHLAYQMRWNGTRVECEVNET